MEKSNSFFRYLAYAVEIILLFVLGTTPNLIPEIFGAKPCFLLCLAISVSVFEREIPSMIIGLICGLLLDYSYCGAIGTFTFALTVACFIIGYSTNNLITARFLSVLLLSFVVIAVIFFLHFVFTCLFSIGDNAWVYFKDHYISRIVLTFIFSPLLYFLNKYIYSVLGDTVN